MSQLSANPGTLVSPPPAEVSKFDRRLSEILACAAQVFAEKGYEGASMRDLSKACGISLAGLYHYFDSKEKLLYLIQRHNFEIIVARLRERLEGIEDTEQRVRVFIRNHLEYFLAHRTQMSVMSHEDNTLKGEFGAEVAALKREYYRLCRELLDSLKRERGLQFETRIAVLSLFGMVNWIYTWYNPRTDRNASALAEEMGDIFLRGLTGRPTQVQSA
ncbi:MAG TPA: TetR/AcrR family transcriptional regulator [Terriglobales bacterium]|jgi:TetR/AcrR family transcriptional regulator, cholesterol catabolism regulator